MAGNFVEWGENQHCGPAKVAHHDALSIKKSCSRLTGQMFTVSTRLVYLSLGLCSDCRQARQGMVQGSALHLEQQYPSQPNSLLSLLLASGVVEQWRVPYPQHIGAGSNERQSQDHRHHPLGNLLCWLHEANVSWSARAS